MDPKKLFDVTLTVPKHEVDDIHYIGEALPAPSNPASLVTAANIPSTGGSAVPAREDHVHDLDLDELETVINNSVTNIIEGDTNIYLGGTDTVDGPTGSFYQEIVFSFSGLIEAVTASPSWPAPYAGWIYEVATVMGTSAALGIIVEFTGSSEILNVTLTDSTVVQTHTLGSAVGILRTNRISVQVDDIDDGLAEDLTIVVRYVAWDPDA